LTNVILLTVTLQLQLMGRL